MRKTLVALLVLVPSFALAAEPSQHTGLNIGGSLGFQNVRGSFYDNDIKPGPAIKLNLGWRIVPQFELETSFYTATGESKAANETAVFVHFLTLDARFFPMGASKIEPNFLIGYTLGAGASIEVGNTTFSYFGYSPNLGGGLRMHASDVLYLSADFRYHYVRLTDAEISGGGIEFDGPLSKEEHGDSFAVMFGGGLQF